MIRPRAGSGRVASVATDSRPIALRMSRLLRLCRSSARRPTNRVVLVAAGLCGTVASLLAAPDGCGLLGAGLALVAVLIAAIDARHFVIPNELSAMALVLGLCHAAICGSDEMAGSLLAAASRGALLALLFWGFRVAYRWLRHREGIGLGDVKLAGVAGVWLSWLTMPVAIEIAALAALSTVLFRQLAFGHTIQARHRLPFGLFFAPSIWLGWLIETAPIFPGLSSS